MPQDAFTLFRGAEQLCRLLAGGKVNKITQPRADEIRMLVYAGGKTRELALSANAAAPRVALTRRAAAAPLVCPNFCMLLRKHLSGAEISAVSLVGFERIVRIDFLHKNELMVAGEKQLYAELMGKYSNLFLAEKGRILGSIKTATLEECAARPTLAGMEYRLPPSQGKADPLLREQLAERLTLFPGGDFARFLFENVAGLARDTAAAVAALTGGAERPPFAPGEGAICGEKIRAVLFGREARPCVRSEGGLPKDFYVFPYPETGGDLTFYPSLAEAATAFYDGRKSAAALAEKKRKLLSAISAYEKKQRKRLAIALEKERAAASLEDDRVAGELITANIYRLKRGDDRATLPDYYTGGERTIALDPRLSPAENAQKYYKKYNKQKKTLEAVAPQRAAAEGEIAYAEALISETELAETPDDYAEIARELEQAGILKDSLPKGKKPRELPLRERVYEIGGLTVRAGRNNLQNDRVTGRAKPEHLWLHVKNYHGCHVVIEGRGEYADETVRAAAEIAAYYSDGRGGDKIPVDYCLKKFVRKAPGAKSGQVFYTDFKTAYVSPRPHADEAKNPFPENAEGSGKTADK